MFFHLKQNNHFDIQIPGGGVGLYNGCQSQWGAPSDGWGCKYIVFVLKWYSYFINWISIDISARYGGVSSASECSQLPAALQPG